MMWHFDHRFATYDADGDTRDSTADEKADPAFRVRPRYWVEGSEVLARLSASAERLERAGLPALLEGGESASARSKARADSRTPNAGAPQWLLGFRDITNATNERTAVFSFLPRLGVGHTMPLTFTNQKPELVFCFVGNLNSIVLDYVARQKVGGTHLTYNYLNQFPVLPPSFCRPEDVSYVASRVLELVYTGDDLSPLADALRTSASPLAADVPRAPYRWDEARRALLRAELDAWFARAYGLTRKQLRYILDPADLTPRELENILDPWEEVRDPLDAAGYAARVAASDFPGETFRVLKEKEQAKFGEYRTRRLVLEAWDRLAVP